METLIKSFEELWFNFNIRGYFLVKGMAEADVTGGMVGFL